MENQTKNFFDKLYLEHSEVYSMQPDYCVRKVLEYMESGEAADFGAGEGRNSIFLAKNGFSVDAYDFSPVAVQKLTEEAKELPIQVETKDIAELKIEKEYDVAVAALVFHFMKREVGLEFLRQMQAHTKIGGLNCIRAKMQKSESSDDEYKKFGGYFYIEDNELQQLYDNWEIIEYDESEQEVRAVNEEGNRKVKRVARMLARKIN